MDWKNITIDSCGPWDHYVVDVLLNGHPEQGKPPETFAEWSQANMAKCCKKAPREQIETAFIVGCMAMQRSVQLACAMLDDIDSTGALGAQFLDVMTGKTDPERQAMNEMKLD